LISLRKTIAELESAEAARRAAAQSFAAAVQTAADNVVEVHPEEAEAFRQKVLQLAGRLEASPTADDIEAARRDYSNQLRRYREQAGERVRRMREELRGAVAAMQAVAADVASGGERHEEVLRREFHNLEAAAEANPATELRAAVRQTIARVTKSFEDLKRAQALAIAQLRDEIRVLQAELDRGRKSAALARLEPVGPHIDRALHRGEAFSVVLLALPGLRALEAQHKAEVLESAVQQMAVSFAALAAGAAGSQPLQVGPWGPGVYAALLPAGVSLGEDWVRLWQQQLTVSQTLRCPGLPHGPRLQPRLAFLAHPAHAAPLAFLELLSRRAAQLLDESSC
jgi:hypothetical protein